jgi:hypothetical protein
MPSPTARRSQADPGGLAGGRRFAPNTGVPPAAATRPTAPKGGLAVSSVKTLLTSPRISVLGSELTSWMAVYRRGTQQSLPVKLPPVKDLVSVHVVRPRYMRNRCSRKQRFLDDPSPFFLGPSPVLCGLVGCSATLSRSSALAFDMGLLSGALRALRHALLMSAKSARAAITSAWATGPSVEESKTSPTIEQDFWGAGCAIKETAARS